MRGRSWGWGVFVLIGIANATPADATKSRKVSNLDITRAKTPLSGYFKLVRNGRNGAGGFTLQSLGKMLGSEVMDTKVHHIQAHEYTQPGVVKLVGSDVRMSLIVGGRPTPTLIKDFDPNTGTGVIEGQQVQIREVRPGEFKAYPMAQEVALPATN